MYALPGHELAGAVADVRAALALAPAHVSHYQLTLEPGTVFGGRPPPGLPDEELSFQMQQQCQAELAAAGYAQYEVSAYARAGAQCAHNLNYWTFGDYLGVGAGAHGKLTHQPRGLITRSVREREPRRYLARGCRGEPATSAVTDADLPFEFMMNALRLNEGFEQGQFEARTGLGWPIVAPRVQQLAARGLLDSGGERWRPTELGRRVLNDLIADFLVAPRSGAERGAGPAVRKNPERSVA
jgi:oxygen-independent coproporphyrinogen-3 oxidase